MPYRSGILATLSLAALAGLSGCASPEAPNTLGPLPPSPTPLGYHGHVSPALALPGPTLALAGPGWETARLDRPAEPRVTPDVFEGTVVESWTLDSLRTTDGRPRDQFNRRTRIFRRHTRP